MNVPTDSLQITYIGNEGVLLDAGRRRVIIDGLFGKQAAPFADASPETIDRLRRALPPFDSVDVILATHHHGDHFDAAAVGAYLENSDAHFVSTRQSTERLESDFQGFGAIAARVSTLSPLPPERARVSVAGVTVEAVTTSHGRVNYGGVEHLALLAQIGGYTVAHFGDAIIDRRNMVATGLLSQRIDVAFLPFWYFTHPFGRRLLRDDFHPGLALAMHLPLDEADRIAGRIQKVFPEAVILRRSLQSLDWPRRR